jgi:hypothetical protein
MSDEHAIPAASIRGVDLEAIAARFPEEAREIARLGDLMERGEETEGEFRRLCELLHTVGETKEGEYLLRRNLAYYEGLETYQRLFGTAIPDNFSRAIASFAEEFGLHLTLRRERAFLDQECQSVPLLGDHSRFTILNGCCDVRFDYWHRDFVTAEIVATGAQKVNYFDLNTCIFLRWQNDRWRLMDPRDA